MTTSESNTTQPRIFVDVASKRLRWPEIIGIAAVLTVVYAAILVIIEHYWPGSEQYAQAVGHVAITVGVVLIVRKLEAPIIEKDRATLINTIQQKYDNILKNSLPLLASINDIGMTRVYRRREDATLQVREAIRATRTQLLMVGVAFYETFSIERETRSLDELIDEREKDAPGKFDARFLLLSPYTTPAVIRSFMESAPADASRYLEGEGKAFLESTLYEDSQRAFRSFNNEVFRERVRFYRRDPGLWMVITDHKVFFEPYTLGRPEEPGHGHMLERRLGGHMPVFEFDRASSPVSKILEEHFARLWAISQDIKDLEPLYSDAEKAAAQLDKEVFAIRKVLLETLVNLLREAEKRGRKG